MDIRVNPGKINGWKPKSHGMSWFRSMLNFCSAFLSYSPTGTSFPRGGLGEAGVFENSADAQQQDTLQGGRVCRGFGGGSFFFLRRCGCRFKDGKEMEGENIWVKKGCL